MTGLSAELLRTAKRLKLIIQYGVGVEGVDIAQVCFTLCCTQSLCMLQLTCDKLLLDWTCHVSMT